MPASMLVALHIKWTREGRVPLTEILDCNDVTRSLLLCDRAETPDILSRGRSPVHPLRRHT
jgi:hypothetical protein